jgi:hypothetical protein
MFGPCSISPPGGWGLQKPPSGVAIDWSHPLSRGLIRRWLSNEASGTVLVDSCCGDKITLSGVNWSPSARGMVPRFDGSSSIGNFNYIPGITTGSSYSISLWLNAPSGNGGLINISNSGTNRNGILLYNSNLGVGYYNGSAYVETSAAITLGSWHHVVLVNLAGAVSGYLNGIPMTGPSQSRLGNSENAIGWNSNAGYFTGLIDDISVYNRALSPSEVVQLCGEPYCTSTAGSPVAAGRPARPPIDASLASDTLLLGALA